MLQHGKCCTAVQVAQGAYKQLTQHLNNRYVLWPIQLLCYSMEALIAHKLDYFSPCCATKCIPTSLRNHHAATADSVTKRSPLIALKFA